MSRHDPSYDYGDRRRHEAPFAADAQRAGRRFLAYLRTRPAESWLFFAAGCVLATLIG